MSLNNLRDYINLKMIFDFWLLMNPFLLLIIKMIIKILIICILKKLKNFLILMYRVEFNKKNFNY